MIYYFSKTQFNEYVEQAKVIGYKANMKDRCFVNGREFTFATNDSVSYLMQYPDAIEVANDSLNPNLSIRSGSPYYFYVEKTEQQNIH